MQIMQNSVDFTESCVEMYQTSQIIAVFQYKTCKNCVKLMQNVQNLLNFITSSAKLTWF